MLIFFAQFLDDKVGWDRLPTLLGVVTLVGLRKRLRERNLFDTGVGPAEAELADPRWLRAYPQPEPSILQPNPLLVSTSLLTRREFIPARGANALVAAWLQFEVHDWFSHGKNLT